MGVYIKTILAYMARYMRFFARFLELWAKGGLFLANWAVFPLPCQSCCGISSKLSALTNSTNL
jgi:hypothetical protein